jgi:hypothetical protein
MKSVLYLCYVGWKKGGKCKPILALRKSRAEKRADAPCNGDKVYHVAMHETLVVPVCAWQMVQEKPFMWENYSEGGTRTLLRTVLLSIAR